MSKVRASRRKFHVVYKTTCLVNNRYYIGLHSTDDLDDNYLGSGIRLQRSLKKYGKEQHTRIILEVLSTRQEAAEREKALITSDLLADPQCLNCGIGGLGYQDRPALSEEQKIKRSMQTKAMHESRTPEQKRQVSEAISKANKVSLNTQKTKLAQSAAAKKRWEDPAYREACGFRGKHTDASRQKMSESKIGKPLARSAEHNAKISATLKARKAAKALALDK